MLAAINLTGLDELVDDWERAPQMTADQLEVFMEGATTFLQSEVQERTPAGHGTLKQSITSEVRKASDSVIGITGTPLAYAIPVELGTRPHFPPVDALVDWVKVKLGISNPSEARNVAFLVARKIAARGTKGAFMFRDAFNAGRSEIERQLRETVDAIVRQLKGDAS